MADRDETAVVIEADAAALRRVTARSMPPLAIGITPRVRPEAGWRPHRLAALAGVFAILALLALGATASERVRRLLIPVGGRTAAAIAGDVRRALARAGFGQPEVEVRRAPGALRIDISARDSTGATLQTAHEVIGTAADSTVQLDLPDFHDLDGLPLEERRRAIERRLAGRGLNVRVRIENGELRIDADERRATKGE